jgi:uncharacterized membrane protein
MEDKIGSFIKKVFWIIVLGFVGFIIFIFLFNIWFLPRIDDSVVAAEAHNFEQTAQVIHLTPLVMVVAGVVSFLVVASRWWEEHHKG